MKPFFVAAISLLSLVSSAYANLGGPPRPPVSQAIQVASLLSVSSTGSTTFEQLIDHNNPSLGTFQQRYWYNTEFWNGPGSPVIVYNPGEVPVLGPNGDFTGYLYNTTLIGQYAQAVGGAAIVIEHRYWGESSPYVNLTPENLQFLTVPQAVQDMTNFAKTVTLPFDTTGNTNAPKAPWVLVGGSYSGALAAWTEITAPGTFWAYHASSAPVQAVENFWEYFQPIQQGMPKACSSDIIAVISHVDSVLTNGTAADKLALKTMFGLSTVVHDADFARILTLPLDLWQVGIPEFMVFCEALEGVPGGQVSPTSNGIGLAAALPNFASYIASTHGCSLTDCYDSYNANQALYTTTQIDTGVIAGRQWQWMLCNEAFGFWQTGAPAGIDSLVSRLVTADYYQQQCNFYFPGVPFGLTEDAHNAKYMGWNVEGTTRVMFSSGEFDPWRSAGVSSEFRPGGPMVSASDIPVFIVPGGVHCQDLFIPEITPEIAALNLQEVAQMKTWIGDFYRANTTSSSMSSTTTSTKTSSSSSTTRATSPSATITPSSSSRITASNSTVSSTKSSTTFASSLRTSSQSHGTASIVTGSSNTSTIHTTQTHAPYNNSTRSYTQTHPTSSILSSVVSKVIQSSISISTTHSVPTTSVTTRSIQTEVASTVYTTEVHTYISCPSSVTSCPATSTRVTTQIISVSTTICPLTISSVSASVQTPSIPIPTSIPVAAHPVSSSISQVSPSPASSVPSNPVSQSSIPTTISTRTRHTSSSKSIPLASGTGTISFPHGGRNSTSFYNYPTASGLRSTGTGSAGPTTSGSPYVGPAGAIPAPVQSAPVQFTSAAGRMEIASMGLFSVGFLIALFL